MTGAGAKLIISTGDRELLESGGRADFRFGDTLSARFETVTVDQTFKGSNFAANSRNRSALVVRYTVVGRLIITPNFGAASPRDRQLCPIFIAEAAGNA
jgi:hypothetical protein